MEIKNILAIRNDRFGEFLLNIPAFRALKESYPGARLTLVTDPYVRELARRVEGVNDVITWENRKHSLPETIRFGRALSKKRFDLAVILNPKKESNIAVFLAGIPERVGYARKWDFLLTRVIGDERHRARKHEVEYNLDLAAAAGAKTNDRTIFFSVAGEDAESGDLIAVHPFTSDPVKQWPLERFRELVSILARKSGKKVAIIGGSEEREKSRGLFKGMEKEIEDLTGKTDLVRLAALLGKCRVLVSGDSGPMHLAAAVGTPVVALFRSDIPGKTSLRWGPWGGGHTVIEKNTLVEISVGEVEAAVMKYR